MFFVLATLVSVVVAALRKCTFDNVVGQPFRWSWLVVGGIFLHLVVALPWFARPLENHPFGLAIPLGVFLYSASFLLLIGFLLANWWRTGFPILFLGLALNLTEILLNGGQMPGDPHQLAAGGFLNDLLRERAAGLWTQFTLVGPTTRLPLLADRIFMPLPFREPVILSIGDLIIALGCFVFFNDVRIAFRRGPFRSRRLSAP